MWSESERREEREEEEEKEEGRGRKKRKTNPWRRRTQKVFLCEGTQVSVFTNNHEFQSFVENWLLDCPLTEFEMEDHKFGGPYGPGSSS
jgi:hypothetical protein